MTTAVQNICRSSAGGLTGSPHSKICSSTTGSTSSLANEPWVRVHVKKLNAQEFHYSTTAAAKTEADYVLDTRTGELYVPDPVAVVAQKCFLIAVCGAPLYTAVQIGWYTARAMINTATIGYNTLKEFGESFAKGDYTEALKRLREGFVENLPSIVGRDLWKVVKAPFYGIAMELAAIYGLFMPYEGRALVGRIEYEWQDRVSFKEGFCLKNMNESPSASWAACLKNLQKAETCYLAFCFQSRGNIQNTAKYQEISRSPIQYLAP